MKKLLTLLVLSCLACCASAAVDSLDTVFNAFIATFAKEKVEWRKDIELTTSPKDIPPGRQLGFSTSVGYFTFMPKTWEDFTPSERVQVTKGPKYTAFVISLRNSNTYPSLGVGETMATCDREDTNLKASAAKYPIDGVPVAASSRKRLAAKTTSEASEKAISDLRKQSAPVTDVTLKKDEIQIDITPEQLIQKEDLNIELY